MHLYHITKEKNLEKIITEGIIPGKRKGLGSNKSNVVWLTNNVKFILKTQAGKEWCVKHNPVIFKIRLDELWDSLRAKIATAYAVPVVCKHEFYVEHTIEPEYIMDWKNWKEHQDDWIGKSRKPRYDDIYFEGLKWLEEIAK